MVPEQWMETSFAVEFYLRCVVSLASASKANRSGLYPYSRQEENTGKSSLPLDQACSVLAETLGMDHAGANIHFSENEIVVLQSRLRDMASGVSGGAGGHKEPLECRPEDGRHEAEWGAALAADRVRTC